MSMTGLRILGTMLRPRSHRDVVTTTIPCRSGCDGVVIAALRSSAAFRTSPRKSRPATPPCRPTAMKSRILSVVASSPPKVLR